MKHLLPIIPFCITLLASLCTHALSHAAVKLPGFFGDHMVLQQESEIPVWGWCDPDEKVRVTLNDNEATTSGDSSGTWRITLPAMMAQTEPLTLRVEGTNSLEINDVLIGEVSTVNDDKTDNIFRAPIGRFADIEEDVQPTHLLVSDYAKWL